MTDAPQNTGPLSDLVVIEMGTLIAGPFCGQILGDFGAEVIKVEDPKVGDPMRQWGRSLPKGLSPWWPVIGRNKKSVGIDLRKPEGQALAESKLGAIYETLGNRDEATKHYQEALRIYKDLGDSADAKQIDDRVKALGR